MFHRAVQSTAPSGNVTTQISASAHVDRRAPGPDRIAPLDERSRAFLRIVAAEDLRLQLAQQFLRPGQVGVRGTHELLGRTEGQWSVPGDPPGQRESRVQDLAGWHDLVDQPER